VLITSLQNARVKEAVKLRDRSGRESQRRIVLDGSREIARALDAGLRVVEAFACPELCDGAAARQLLARLRKVGIEPDEVTPAVFAKLAFGERSEGIVATAETPGAALADLKWPQTKTPPLVVVLEGVEKPGNLGAVIRSADGAGVSAVIAADLRTDLYNPNAIRASLGTIFTMPVAAAPSSEVRAWLAERQMAVVAARTDGAVPYSVVDFRQGTAIVLGSEAHGLSSAWQGTEVRSIVLPMLGKGDSLNVSTAAAVLMYEARRQRGN